MKIEQKLMDDKLLKKRQVAETLSCSLRTVVQG